jgi:hypothetical protein
VTGDAQHQAVVGELLAAAGGRCAVAGTEAGAVAGAAGEATGGGDRVAAGAGDRIAAGDDQVAIVEQVVEAGGGRTTTVDGVAPRRLGRRLCR